MGLSDLATSWPVILFLIAFGAVLFLVLLDMADHYRSRK